MILPAVAAIEWTEVGGVFFDTRPRTLSEQLIDRDIFWNAIQRFPFFPTFGGKLWSCHQILPQIGGQSFASLLSQCQYDLNSVLLAGHSYALHPHDLYGIVYRFRDEDRAYYFVKPYRQASSAEPNCLCCVVVTPFATRLPSLSQCAVRLGDITARPNVSGS